MSEQTPSLRGRLKTEPVGPLGELMADALGTLSFSLSEAAEAVKQAAARTEGVRNPTCNASTVRKWIHDCVIPHPAACRWISAGWHIPLDRLSAAVDAQREFRSYATESMTLSPETAYDPDMQRRQFMERALLLLGTRTDATLSLMASLTGAATSGAPEPYEQLEDVLRYPSHVSAATLEHLEQVLISLESVERHVEAEALIGAVLGHLNALISLLRGVLPSAVRPHICSLAGETACLAARLYMQISSVTGASSYFHSALKAAREAQDHALVAYIIGIMAGQPAYRDDPQARLDLLKSCSPQLASPATQVFLAAKRADAYALLGDSDACLAALSTAEAALSLCAKDTATSHRPRAPWWPHDTWLAGEHGATLARLGQHRRAEEMLMVVLAKDLNAKHRLWLTVALARAHAGSRQPEEASRLAIDVLARATPLHMASVVNEVVYLRQELNSWKELPPVRDLDDALGQTPQHSA